MNAKSINFLQENNRNMNTPALEDEFLKKSDLIVHSREVAIKASFGILSQTREYFKEKKWDDIIALFYPLSEKAPEACGSAHEVSIRANIGFALNQKGRYDDALSEMRWCVEQEPDNFMLTSSLAYTAYDSLFAVNKREIFLHGKHKKERIDLAVKYMEISRNLKPESIANFYRHGVLLSEIERKPDKALPFFIQAIQLWEEKTTEQMETLKQEKRHYVKSLYHGSRCLFEKNHLCKAFEMITKCLEYDSQIDHIEPVFKYFLKGKILFFMRKHEEAKAALEASFTFRGDEPADYVIELQARNYLVLNDYETALSIIRKIPGNRKRPYCRWTEADILCAMERFKEAETVLSDGLDRDKKSKHKTLVRLSKISYLYQRYDDAAKLAREAKKFFQETWGKSFSDGIFWEALSLLRAGDKKRAMALSKDLEAVSPWYPPLLRLKQLLMEQA
jgi:tetratricopeptide (TPR) repeat protein